MKNENTSIHAFFCDKDEYTEEQLKEFTKDNKMSVVIRQTAIVENGKITYFEE